jgi:hypothetical protein
MRWILACASEPSHALLRAVADMFHRRDVDIAVWDAAFNIWEAGGERKSPVM